VALTNTTKKHDSQKRVVCLDLERGLILAEREHKHANVVANTVAHQGGQRDKSIGDLRLLADDDNQSHPHVNESILLEVL
jgi:hypothetical protein